jgi:hypothetical protein
MKQLINPPSPPPTPAQRQPYANPMTTQQTAIIIRECIREAARANGCKPSEALNPGVNNRPAIKARDEAIRDAYEQGVDKSSLSIAFGRTMRTIVTALKRTPCNH